MVAHALFDRSVTVSLCLPLAGCGSTALAMSSTSPVDMPAFATRLARAKFRAWHRGTREADYMIGGFFDRFHAQWGEAEMAWFEALLEEDFYNANFCLQTWRMHSKELGTYDQEKYQAYQRIMADAKAQQAARRAKDK